jgi:hypothetical protein
MNMLGLSPRVRITHIWHNTMRDFRPRNTLCTLNTTLHVSTLLGSSSGVLFFHYNSSLQRDIHLCPYVMVPVVGLGGTIRYGPLVNRVQNTLMVLALNLVVYALSYLGEYHLWDPCTS